MLESHSAFVNCEERACTWCSVRLVVTVLYGVIPTAPGSSISYPTARMRSEYSPEASLFRGKLYCPRESLTTLTDTVDPVFLALTKTPSMGPSSVELTRPTNARAPSGERLQELDVASIRLRATPAVTLSQKVFARIIHHFAGSRVTTLFVEKLYAAPCSRCRIS